VKVTRISRAPDASRRNDRSRQAILRAAWDLLDRGGFPALTIEGVARRAGVGKATIYRWWPNKAAIVMDAMSELALPHIPFPDTGSTREDLRRQMTSVTELFPTKAGRALLALIGESQHDALLAAALRDRLIVERRESASEVLRRGVARGEVRADIDPGIAIDALYGALYYRLQVSHAPVDPAYVDALIDQLWPALAAAP
jgi:AcrR family transcriptional regulator